MVQTIQTTIKTFGELKKSSYVSKGIKEEIRANLIKKISKAFSFALAFGKYFFTRPYNPSTL